jgi:RNA exonuclease NGL2
MGYDMVYASGPNKKHGCMIAFLREKYAKVDEHVVHMDIAAAGATFKTKNIGSLVALREQGIAEKGIVVATTHLFWHPSYTYERTRSALNSSLYRHLKLIHDQASRYLAPRDGQVP